MRLLLTFSLVVLLSTSPSLAQTPAPPASSSPQFESVTLGEPMSGLRSRLGDPVHFTDDGHEQIWRYIECGGAVFLDLLVQKNVVYSVTVIRRFDNSPYTDPNGAAFGMTSAQLQAKFGAPQRTTTNADDGSVDLWYYSDHVAWIYEFYSDKLGFIQLVASPDLRSTFATGSPVLPADGTSIDRAILIRPSNLLADTMWIDAYLAMNACGSTGHWREIASKLAPDLPNHDLLAYSIVHARCTVGTGERDFYFDTHGAMANSGNKSQTIYVDSRQLPQVSPSPSSPPH